MRGRNRRAVLYYLEDNHTSVIGMREVAMDRDVDCHCLLYSDVFNFMRSNEGPLCACFKWNQLANESNPDSSNNNIVCNETEQTSESMTGKSLENFETLEVNNLFVFPSQSNYNGAKYPLEWVSKAQTGTLIESAGTTLVCIDAASHCSTSSLDLAKTQPDFVTISFYKIFGFPSGLGKYCKLSGP